MDKGMVMCYACFLLFFLYHEGLRADEVKGILYPPSDQLSILSLSNKANEYKEDTVCCMTRHWSCLLTPSPLSMKESGESLSSLNHIQNLGRIKAERWKCGNMGRWKKKHQCMR